MSAGTNVRVWLPDPSPDGGSFWLGTVLDRPVFTDGAIAVRLRGTGGVVAKVAPRQVFVDA